MNEVISLANATGHFPPEYTALSITHIPPWVPVDSVVFGKLQAFQLSFDFDDGRTNELASVTGVLGPATGETAFYQDLARSEPAENAFTVPDANGTPIPLAAVAAPQAGKGGHQGERGHAAVPGTRWSAGARRRPARSRGHARRRSRSRVNSSPS